MSKKVKILFFLISISLFLCTGCVALIIKNNYSTPKDRNKFHGYLIRGDGWNYWTYGFAIDNVHQIEDENYIIAVKINNYYESIWATGLIVPFIPLFGIPKEGYNGEVEKGIKGVTITIAIFMKNNNKFIINPCKIKISKKNEYELLPITYQYSFNNENNIVYKCDEKYKDNPLIMNGKFYDIMLFDITYRNSLYPQKNINIVFPNVSFNGNNINLPHFKFKKGTGFIWTVVL